MNVPAQQAAHPRAAEVAAGLERLLALIRWLSPPGLSLTAAATLSTLDRSGPCRLTALAAGEGVTQPAMTQLVARLADSGLVARSADPADGRVVYVHITPAGRPPRAVFAAAFACVVSFRGIGLVDPTLPSISHQLHASRSEVPLLFTSYLVVTAVAMLITNWVSSRLGAKRTLIAGLTLIVIFSALAGASPSIGAIIGFRAGWGVGNALFIATSLAVIVASASGRFAGAIVLDPAAPGLRRPVGPLLGGTVRAV